MNPAIRLFFYRSKSGVPNFGDELSPEVVAFLTGRRVHRANRWRCDLLGIGSILDKFVTPTARVVSDLRLALGRPVMVWGSGLIEDCAIPKNAMSMLAVRGKFSRDALCADLNTPLGDPGLLVANMMRGGRARKGIGIVPHYMDKQHEMVIALSRLPGVRIIDVERGGSEVCAEIAECSVVFSSSLHGLIVADAFGIPNHRLHFSGKLKGGDFKFLDYASALGRNNIKAVALSEPEEIFSLAKLDLDLDYQLQVDKVCSSLEAALRQHF